MNDLEKNPYLVEDLEPEEANPLEEREGASLPNGPLLHQRTTPLPLRIKSGHFTEEALVGETPQGTVEIPWSEVEYVALGMIVERSEQEAEAYKVQRLVKGISRMATGGSPSDDKDKIVSYKPTNYLDLYCRGREAPLRFDSLSVNYRGFLGPNLSHVSFQNFFRLVREVCRRCSQAQFLQGIKPFLAWDRDHMRKYQAVHDFENETFLAITRRQKLIPWSELDFTRTGWADGWQEDQSQEED